MFRTLYEHPTSTMDDALDILQETSHEVLFFTTLTSFATSRQRFAFCLDQIDFIHGTEDIQFILDIANHLKPQEKAELCAHLMRESVPIVLDTIDNFITCLLQLEKTARLALCNTWMAKREPQLWTLTEIVKIMVQLPDSAQLTWLERQFSTIEFSSFSEDVIEAVGLVTAALRWRFLQFIFIKSTIHQTLDLRIEEIKTICLKLPSAQRIEFLLVLTPKVYEKIYLPLAHWDMVTSWLVTKKHFPDYHYVMVKKISKPFWCHKLRYDPDPDVEGEMEYPYDIEKFTYWLNSLPTDTLWDFCSKFDMDFYHSVIADEPENLENILLLLPQNISYKFCNVFLSEANLKQLLNTSQRLNRLLITAGLEFFNHNNPDSDADETADYRTIFIMNICQRLSTSHLTKLTQTLADLEEILLALPPEHWPIVIRHLDKNHCHKLAVTLQDANKHNRTYLFFGKRASLVDNILQENALSLPRSLSTVRGSNK